MPTQFKGQFNWSLVGIPDHAGVMNVGGRIGAALGPQAFRKAFERMKGRHPVQGTLRDRGDVKELDGAGARVANNHLRASDWVREAHVNATGPSVVIGGGHDHGFSHLRGIAEAIPGKRIGCINIDAHLDVRRADPGAGLPITSGSPFFLALESGVLKSEDFVEFGIQSHSNAPELWEYVEAKGVEVIPFASTRGPQAIARFRSSLAKLSTTCDRIVVSLDLDGVAQAFAPGVSAPQSEGFTPSEIIEMMEESGRNEKVISLGIFELNPLLDLDERTARLAATAAWHFIESRILATKAQSA